MPSYVRQIRVETTFDGQTVVAQLRPLTWADVLRLQGEDEQTMVSIYAQMLPQYLVSLSTLQDADGAAVAQEEVLANAFFAPLLSHLLGEHVGAARPTNP